MSERTASVGAWPRKSTSSDIDFAPSAWPTPALELLVLVGAGLLAVALHASVHWPLKLPGHHGLEWMALLMFARTTSGRRWAALVAGASAAGASMLPVWGFHETSIGLGYLLSGFAVDLWWRLVPPRRALPLALGSALAHATKPLWKLGASAGFGLHFGSIAGGVGTALVAHLMFGFAGGLAGALAGTALRSRLQRRDDAA